MSLLRNPVAYLESNSVIILAGINCLGNPAVGSIGTDHHIHLQSAGLANFGILQEGAATS